MMPRGVNSAVRHTEVQRKYSTSNFDIGYAVATVARGFVEKHLTMAGAALTVRCYSKEAPALVEAAVRWQKIRTLQAKGVS